MCVLLARLDNLHCGDVSILNRILLYKDMLAVLNGLVAGCSNSKSEKSIKKKPSI
jgi:hypothetical protein